MKEYYYVLPYINYNLWGYTDNKFIFDTYYKQLEQDELITKHSEIITGSFDAKNEQAFLDNINSYFKAPLTIEHKLCAISDEIYTNDIFVINNKIYESFVRRFTIGNEINKILNLLYSHFGQNWIINDYIKDDSSSTIQLLSDRINNMYVPMIRMFSEYSEYEMLAEIMRYDRSKIWGMLNEYEEFKRYFYLLVREDIYPIIG